MSAEEPPPSPAEPPWLQTLRWLVDPVGYVLACRSRFGAIFAIDVLGWGRLILNGDAEASRRQFQEPSTDYSGGEANAILQPVVGARSVFVVEGQAHRAARLAIKPLLAPGALLDRAPQLDDLVIAWLDEMPSHGKALAKQVRRLTMRLMTLILFGDRDADRAASLERCLAPLLGAGASILAFIPSLQRDFGPISPIRWLGRRLSRLNAELRTLRAQAGAERTITDEEAAQHASLLVAGYDTTAAGLCWTLYWLSRSPAVVERLRAEIDPILHDSPRQGLELLLKAPYLNAVYREGLRVTPTIDFYPRTQMPLRAGRRVMVAPCSLLTHADADRFPEPERFNPDRFQDQGATPTGYMPYGGGARRCPGAELSRLIILLAVARTIQKFDLAITSANVRPSRRNVVLIPSPLAYRLVLRSVT